MITVSVAFLATFLTADGDGGGGGDDDDILDELHQLFESPLDSSDGGSESEIATVVSCGSKGSPLALQTSAITNRATPSDEQAFKPRPAQKTTRSPSLAPSESRVFDTTEGEVEEEVDGGEEDDNESRVDSCFNSFKANAEREPDGPLSASRDNILP